MKKSIVMGGVAVALVAGVVGGNMQAKAKAEEVMKEGFLSANASYSSLVCSSTFFNPTCVVEGLKDPENTVYFKKITLSNLRELGALDKDNPDGKVPINLKVEGMRIGLVDSTVKTYKKVNPMLGAVAEEVVRLTGADALDVSLTGELGFDKGYFKEINGLKVTVGTKALTLDATTSGKFEGKGVLAKEFDPTSLGGDDFLIYGLTSGIKISDRDALIDAWGVFQSGRLPTEDGRKEFRKKTNDSISAEVEKAIGAKTRQEVSSDAAMGEREKKVALQGMDALSRVAKGEKNSLYFTFESKSTDFNAFIAGLDTGKISDDVKVALVN